MTKSIIKNADGTILIEINKKGINAILVDGGKIKVEDFDGVEFKEKIMKKEEFVVEVVKRLSNCFLLVPLFP